MRTSIKECVDKILAAKSIAIIGHKLPDADALSSAIALKKLIRQNRPQDVEVKTIDIFVDTDVISAPNDILVSGVEYNAPHLLSYDLCICVDCDNLSRLGKYEDYFVNAVDTINFDHHPTNTHFANTNIILNTSSTCEALYVVAKSQKFVISDEVCKYLYAGIITDTNNLTQGVITDKTFKFITAAIARGIDLESINSYFFKNNNKSKTQLLRKALATMKFYVDDRVAFMKIEKSDLEKLGATFEDTLGIVDQGIGIKGVDVAVLAIKQKDNSYYVSMRSKNNIKINEIAKTFGGGGHDKAAAFQFEGSSDKLREVLLPVLEKELSATPTPVSSLYFEGDEPDDKKEIM